MGVYIPRLPNAYQEVERIQSSGTQYIDTGKTVDGNTSATYTYMPKEYVDSSTAGGVLVGMDNGWKVNGFGSGNVYVYFGNQTSSGAGVTLGTLTQDTMYTDVCSKSGCSRNGGTVWTPPSTTTAPSGTLKLFVFQRNGSITNYYKTRFYSFKRWDSGVLTQDLVPCYRKSDSVIGVYDLVGKQFYTNSGTGTFTKGANVTAVPLNNAYIGDPGWTLYKETDFKNSSWGGFRVLGWNGASSASNVSFNTTNGYIYSSSTLSQANILPLVADLTTFSSAKAIKIVCDGIYRGNNTNSYNTSVGVGSIRFGKNSSEDRLSDATLLTGSKPGFSTWYTCEFIIEKNGYGILTVSNGSTYQTNYNRNTLVASGTNGWFNSTNSAAMYGFGYINRNQGTGCQLKDIHVYIRN